MTALVSIVGSYLLFAAVGYSLWRLIGRRDARIAELELQLFQAWKDGYQIPPAPSALPEPEEEIPLPEELLTVVNDWESPETRASLADSFRTSLRQGYSPRAVFHRYVDGLYGGTPSPE